MLCEEWKPRQDSDTQQQPRGFVSHSSPRQNEVIWEIVKSLFHAAIFTNLGLPLASTLALPNMFRIWRIRSRDLFTCLPNSRLDLVQSKDPYIIHNFLCDMTMRYEKLNKCQGICGSTAILPFIDCCRPREVAPSLPKASAAFSIAFSSFFCSALKY